MKPDFSLFVLQVRFIEDVIGTIMSGAVYFYSEILVGILTSLINTHTHTYIFMRGIIKMLNKILLSFYFLLSYVIRYKFGLSSFMNVLSYIWYISKTFRKLVAVMYMQ